MIDPGRVQRPQPFAAEPDRARDQAGVEAELSRAREKLMVRDFLFVALPLKLEGGTASPLAPIAVTEEFTTVQVMWSDLAGGKPAADAKTDGSDVIGLQFILPWAEKARFWWGETRPRQRANRSNGPI